MSSRFPSPPAPSGEDRAAEQQAADWLARRNGGLSPAEQAELAAWVAQDARHARALAELERTWAWLNQPRHTGCADRVAIEIGLLRRRAQRRQAVRSVLGLAAAVALAGLVWRQQLPTAAPESSAPAAVALRPIVQTLPDGSKVALRPGAAIEVDFAPDFRRVRLVRGEALFTVAKNADRPFLVQAGAVVVRAVGTEFSVDRGNRAVVVLVTEGRIAVQPPGHTAPLPVFAGAGERVVIDTAAGAPLPAVSAVAAQEMAAALAWRGTRLEFSATPLAEAVRRFNQGDRPHIVLADPEIGRRTITGVLWADDREGFVRLLESGFDLVATPNGNEVRLSQRP